MSYYQINLKAGISFQQDTPGQLLLLDSIGVANEIDITLISPGGNEKPTINNRKAGFRHVMAFEAVRFLSDVDTTIQVFLSFDDVQLGFVAGSSVEVPGGVQITNDAAHRIPVDLGGAAIAVTVTDMGINNPDTAPVPVKLIASVDTDAIPTKNQALGTIVNIAPVVVGIAEVPLVSDATLRRLRFRNSHATATVAIGAVGITLANGAIVLGPGAVYFEDDAAGAAWYGISDTAATSIQIQGVK